MESRTQGSRPRPRTQKNFEAKDTNKILRPRPRTQKKSRSRPRTDPLEAKDTGASVLQKKGFQKFFQAISKKRSSKIFSGGKGLQKIFFRQFPFEENKKGLRKFSARFLALSNKISTVQKIVLSSSRGQGNFRGLEASRPRPRT